MCPSYTSRSMDVRFRLVDVFTERPFAGNQLCVVPAPPKGLDAETMQMLAREIGFSETAFVTDVASDRYRMRIFTPEEEMPFAGHPTLGTAFALVADGRVGTPVLQTTTAGEVRVEIDVAAGFGWMHQLPPVFGIEVDDRQLLTKAAGLAPEDLHPDLSAQVVSTGVETLLVPIRDEAALRRAERNGGACRELAERAGAWTLYFFAMLGEGEILARMLDPGLGIGEDPATGSAAGPLGAYLAEHKVGGMPGRLLIRQGELIGRPSFLHVEVTAGRDGWDVGVGGGVRIVGSGSFELG